MAVTSTVLLLLLLNGKKKIEKERKTNPLSLLNDRKKENDDIEIRNEKTKARKPPPLGVKWETCRLRALYVATELVPAKAIKCEWL